MSVWPAHRHIVARTRRAGPPSHRSHPAGWNSPKAGGQGERREHRRLFEGGDVGQLTAFAAQDGQPAAGPFADLRGDHQPYVLAQQGDQRLRVGVLMRGDEPLEQAALPGIEFGGRCPGQPTTSRRISTAR